MIYKLYKNQLNKLLIQTVLRDTMSLRGEDNMKNIRGATKGEQQVQQREHNPIKHPPKQADRSRYHRIHR